MCDSVISDPHEKDDIATLEKVQRRVARFDSENRVPPSESSVTKIIKDLGWQSLRVRRTSIRLTFMFKIVHELVDIEASKLVERKHTTRRSSAHH